MHTSRCVVANCSSELGNWRGVIRSRISRSCDGADGSSGLEFRSATQRLESLSAKDAYAVLALALRSWEWRRHCNEMFKVFGDPRWMVWVRCGAGSQPLYWYESSTLKDKAWLVFDKLMPVMSPASSLHRALMMREMIVFCLEPSRTKDNHRRSTVQSIQIAKYCRPKSGVSTCEYTIGELG